MPLKKPYQGLFIWSVTALKAFSSRPKFWYDISGYFLPSIAEIPWKSGYFLYIFDVRPKYNAQLYPVNVDGYVRIQIHYILSVTFETK
jgi:hypothetical protein